MTKRARTESRRWRGVARQVDTLDVAVFDAVAHTSSPLLDATMPRLTRAADRSVLWIAIAGALTLSRRPRARAAAVRGLASIAVTSLVANQVSKRLHRRPRPSITQVPAQRLAHRIPTSTSFPSGHSASAMAFAAGASAEWPALSVPLRALAGLVGFSRVATGAHYPGDVAAGFALGEAIAWLTGTMPPMRTVAAANGTCQSACRSAPPRRHRAIAQPSTTTTAATRSAAGPSTVDTVAHSAVQPGIVSPACPAAAATE